MDYLLGLDMGTTHLKAALFTTSGEQHQVEMMPTKTNHLGDGKATYDPAGLWSGVSILLRRLTASLKGDDKVLALSIASMGEAGLLLDESGHPLTPIICWFDSRGHETAAEWFGKFGEEKTLAITGLQPNYIYSLLKILWLKKHEPETFARARKWLCVPDYVAYRLTGEFATDYSIASRTMAFDIRTRTWSEEILAAAGLDKDLFPTPYQGGTVIGEVAARAAEETGLTPGTPVVAGGHDHICGALAAGVFRPGRVLDSSGTAESVVAAAGSIPGLCPEAVKGFNVGCHVVPDVYYLQAGINASGLSVEWFKTEFGLAEQQEAEEKEVSVYQILAAEADQSPAGARGLIYIPHLRGSGPPHRDRNLRAAFLGMRDYHQRADFIRAIFEGLSFEFRNTLKAVESVLQTSIPRAYAIGGGAKNEVWMRIKVAVLQKSIEVPAVSESTLLGAAVLGGIGAGVYKDAAEALASTYRPARTFDPEPELVNKYESIFANYRQAIPLYRGLNNCLFGSK